MGTQGFWTADLEGTLARMLATLVQFSTTAARPAASAATEGMFHVATDSPFAISYDNGGAWITIGATVPQGELGGTWASPTVDTVHSGSAHNVLMAEEGSGTSVSVTWNTAFGGTPVVTGACVGATGGSSGEVFNLITARSTTGATGAPTDVDGLQRDETAMFIAMET